MSDSEDEVTEKQFKILIIGDPSVGKTTLSNKYVNDCYSKLYTPTSGVDFHLKRIVLPGERHITLKIWDISGTALQGNMLDKYVFGSNAIILLYDVTDMNTFLNLEKWLVACQTKLMTNGHREASPTGVEKQMVFALVANKIDLEHLRTVKSEKHHKLAQVF